MQKPLQLAFQGSYTKTQVSIAQGQTILDTEEILGTRSSSALVPTVEKLLQKHALKLPDFDFFAVNHGPGAFTSLRVVVVTINALSFGCGVKILPVCGLKALFEKFQATKNAATPDCDFVACMLNAYSKQAFITIFDRQGNPQPEFNSICLRLDEFSSQVALKLKGQKILMFGNGAQDFVNRAPELIFDAASAVVEPDSQSVAMLANKLFLGGQQPQPKVTPNYIKTNFI